MIGETILHYEIIEKLGEGGMGVVYKAEDTKLERDVAIKLLPRQIAANAEERKRFKIEAKAAAALNHPNIATIHAIEEVDDELFIVMEYIEGKELKEIVGTQDVMPLPDVLNYATQIAEGLQAAHKKGITHRDIKSGNIMITEDGQVKIMDFGLAKIAGGAQLTKDHSTLGTAAYMSPEQARGEPVDHRADVWSFGVVLYEMLTGQMPFKGDYEQAVIYSIMNEEPNPLSNLCLETPESLQGVVLRALAKDAAERFQSMDAIVAELKEIQTKSFRTETFLKPRLTGRFSKHARSTIVAGSIVLAVGIILALIFYFQPFSTPKAKFSSIAIMPLVQENGPPEEQSWIADAILDLLYTELAQYQSIRVLTAQERHTIMKNLGIPDDSNLSLEQCFQIAQKANSEGIILANLIMSQDTLTIYDVRIFETASTRLVDRIGPIQGQVNQIYDTVDKLSSEIKQLINLGTSTKAKSANALARTPASLDAYRYYLEGRDAALDNRYKDAIPKLRRAINLDSTFVQAYYHLAWQYTKIYEYDNAKAVLSKGKPYVENLPEKERLRYLSHEASIDRRWRDYITYIESLIKISPSSASLYYQYGYVQFLFFRKVDIAISSLQKSLKYDSTITDAYKTLGYVHLAKGEKDKAFQYIEEYVRLKPTDVEPLLSLADVQILTGLYREALRNCEKILTAQPDYQRALYYIAQAYLGQGKNSKAIETTNHYLDEVSVPSYRADGHVLLSRIYFSEDNLMEALEHVEQAIRLDSDYSDAYWLHGLMLLKQGDTQTARNKLTKLQQLLVNKHGLEDKWLVYHLKAQILLAEESYHEALEHLHRALELFPPDRSFYLTALGNAFMRSKHLAKASASYRQALEFNPNNAQALLGLNQVLEKKHLLTR